jgi:ferric-dicitrate binding protein FerR (iron transport regulator)
MTDIAEGDELVRRIEALPRELVFEAAYGMSRRIAAGGDLDAGQRAQLGDFLAAPERHLGDIEQVGRLVLLGAAATPAYQPAVEKALDNAGRRNLVLGGAEIVALAALGVYALQVLLSKGRTIDTTVTTTTKANGDVVMSYKEVHWGIPHGIQAALGAVMPAVKPPDKAAPTSSDESKAQG